MANSADPDQLASSELYYHDSTIAKVTIAMHR